MSKVVVLVEDIGGAWKKTTSSPTELGCILESAKNGYLILSGCEYAWVQQVITNLKQGYSYIEHSPYAYSA